MNDRERMIDSVARHAPWMKPAEVDGGAYDGSLTWVKADATLRLCDFCARSSVGGKSYPCADFVVRTVMPPQVEKPMQIVARGDWGACPECAVQIDAGSRAGLLQRMFDARPAARQPAPHVRRVLQGTEVSAAKVLRKCYSSSRTIHVVSSIMNKSNQTPDTERTPSCRPPPPPSTA
jgi:hypothetical protein